MFKSKLKRTALVICLAMASSGVIAGDDDEPFELDFDRPEITIEEPADVNSPALVGLFFLGALLVVAGRKNAR